MSLNYSIAILSNPQDKNAPAHGFNRRSIGICYEGGLDAGGCPADTRIPQQKDTLQRLLLRLKKDYPDARIVGHRDLPEVKKDCPCYAVLYKK